jgi:NADP-dependent aldehyde dehydrogenase
MTMNAQDAGALGNLVAGRSDVGGRTFDNDPVAGPARSFPAGSAELVDRACRAARAAFEDYASRSRTERADFLRRCAAAIEARGGAITEIGTAETGLPEARLDGERGRTVGQLRLFADHIEAGDHLDARHDTALPDRTPLPRPDLRLIMRPIGPVGVFGASNFPLAFSVAGGDTASALATGCPVVVKGHPGHPGTGAIVGEAIAEAAEAADMPAGVFSLVNDGGPDGDGADSRAVGAALVRHPAIRAVGFTGSLGGGRALFDLAAARPDPIPFFGELGSVNPVFVMPAAAKLRAEQIARGWIASLTMGAGQFCTNPGLIVVPEAAADSFVDAARGAASNIGEQTMLTPTIANAHRHGVASLRVLADIVQEGSCDGRGGAPTILRLSAAAMMAAPETSNEIFGPSGVIVVARDVDEMVRLARSLEGQLTATLQIEADDHHAARDLLPALEAMAGRILANGFPTGVEVAHAMMHGGPWPASTDPRFTSVGTMSIRRWLRPICYQDIPEEILSRILS